MKKHLAVVFTALLVSIPISVRAELIAVQEFDSAASDTWTFTSNPGSYVEASGSDVWNAQSSVGTGGNAISAQSGSNFWAIRDLNNSGSGGNFFHELQFDSQDISQFESVSLSFEYNAFEFDTNDDLKYEVFVDNVSQGEVVVVDGLSNFSSGGWQSVSVNIDDAASSVSLLLSARQDGGGDWGGWDNIQLNGTAVIPEPASLFLFGTVAALYGFRRRS